MGNLGKYELLGELGRGAFGIVYRARDPIISRMVALKTMTNSVAGNPALLQRFYREAQSAGSLQHPNIVTIFDMGDQDGTPFIAMELVDGQTLDDVIVSRVPVPLSLKLVYAVQACRAFDYAHKRGIIHRDIKPGNVMVNKDGIVKVVDFGIARVLESSKTQTGMLIGTFSYMAPELFHGEHANERSDIWSFGVLLYELIASRRPFCEETPAALMRSICEQEHLPLREAAPHCPADLEAVVHKTLRKSDAERFLSMEDLLLELDPICRRLQAENVAELLAQGRELVEQGEFAQARDLLRQALRVDPTNLQVRVLSEKVNVELRRMSVRPQVQERVEKARALLQEGRLQEADTEAGNALALDSSFEIAKALQREVQDRIRRAQTINEWLDLAKQHLAEGLPDEADALLAKVAEADPSNRELPGLRQQVLDEQERRQRQARLLEGMQQARAYWTQQNYQECIAVLTELQKDFAGEEEIERLLETAREEQAEQNKQERLSQGRNLLALQQYEECATALAQLQAEFPGDEEIRRLLDAARAEEAEQQKERRLADARKLLAAQQHEECIALLVSLQQQFVDDDEITRLLAAAREDQAEHGKKDKVAAARRLLAAQRFADALALLDAVLATDPKDSAVLKLRTLVQREQEKQASFEILRREWEVLKKLVGERAYPDVVTRAENLLQQFPGDAALMRVVEFARKQQAQIESGLRFRAALDEIQAHLNANRFPEAAAAAQSALEAFPGNTQFTALLEQAQAREKKEVVRKLIERRVRDIKVKINRGELSEAKEMAREALTTLGPDTDVNQLLASAEVEYEAREKKRRQQEQLETIRTLIQGGKIEKAATTLDEMARSGDFHALDPRLYQVADALEAARKAAAASPLTNVAAEPAAPAREYALLEGPPVAGEGDAAGAGAPQAMQPLAEAVPVSAPAGEGVAGQSEPILDVVEKQLAAYLGPVAKIVVRKAALRARNAEELYALLAENLEREEDRKTFLAGRVESRAQFKSESPAEPVARSAAPAPQTALPREVIDRAAAILARYVGPIAGVLAKRTAPRADSARALHLLLAQHVETEADRARFLRDAGAPERS
ncbi:MAG: protein kinase [Acidobacteriia bacterium]|nr:protein kinase [Terriglobia bacterium]